MLSNIHPHILPQVFWRRLWSGGHFLTNEIVRESSGSGTSIGMTHAGNDVVVNAKSRGMSQEFLMARVIVKFDEHELEGGGQAA